MISKLGSYVIGFLIIYIPLDGFYLKWLPISANISIILSQVPDFAVLGLFTMVFLNKYLRAKPFKIIDGYSEFNLLLFTFMFIGIAIIFSNNFVIPLLNIKALLRYIPLIYIILNLRYDQRFKSIIKKSFYFIFSFELIVGLLQLIFGEPLQLFFLPPIVDPGLAGISSESVSLRELKNTGAIFGTMDKTIDFGLFLLVGLILCISFLQKTTVKFWVFISIILFELYFTYSRSVILVGAIILTFDFFLKFSVANKIRFLWVILLGSTCVILASQFSNSPNDLLYFLTEEYIENAKSQRLGIITTIVPEFFNSSIKNILFGFTSDTELLFQKFLTIPDRPILLIDKAAPIEDVYWVALLYYYGIVGTVLISIYFFSIFKKFILYRNRFKNVNVFNLGVLICLASILLNFLNQAFEVSPFSFYLWLFLGIALHKIKEFKNEYYSSRKQL